MSGSSRVRSRTSAAASTRATSSAAETSASELEPPAGSLAPHEAGARHLRRAGPRRGAVDDEHPVAAEEAGRSSMAPSWISRPWSMTSSRPAQADEVVDVVGGEHDGRPLGAVQLERGSRGRRPWPRRRGRWWARRGTAPRGAGSTAAASSARMRWPRDAVGPAAAACGPEAEQTRRKAGRAALVVDGRARRTRWRTNSERTGSGRSHQSDVRWPNSTPMRAPGRVVGARARGRPPVTVPEVGAKDAGNHLGNMRSILFRQPLGPAYPTNSPAAT